MGVGAQDRAAAIGAPGPWRVLVGGLGMGFTLREAVDAVPAGSSVVVVEAIEAVLAWNRGPVAGRPLDDPRATAVNADVFDFMRSSPAGGYDAILRGGGRTLMGASARATLDFAFHIDANCVPSITT